MKKDLLQEGVRGLRNIRLSDAERQAVFSRLMEHVDQHPAPVVSPWKLYVSQYRFAFALASMFIIIVTGGATASAAEHALPGDVLYPIKISVLEPLRGALIIGAVPNANWAEEKTVRRLEEAETLAAQGKLNVATVQILKDNFAKSAGEFNAIVAASASAASSTALVDARIDFEAKMSAHSQILASFASSSPQSEQEDMAPLVRLVDEHVRSSKDDRVNAVQVLIQSTEGSATTSPERGDGKGTHGDGDIRTQNQTTQSLFTSRAESIQSLIHTTEDRLRDSVDQTSTTSTSVQSVILDSVPQTLQSAKDSLKDAEQQQVSGNSNQAFSALLDSESSAKQADTSVKQSERLGHEQRNSGRDGGRQSGDNQDKRD